MLYLIFFVLTLFVLLFLTNKRQAGIIILILSIMYVAISYPGGNDWLGYFSFYNCEWNDVCQPDSTYFEPGYVALVYMFGFWGYYFLSLIIALITLVRLYYFCKHFDRPGLVYFFFMAMFLWVLYFEAVRQALALTFVFSAIIAGYKNKRFSFTVFVIVAALFHASALILLIMLLPLYSIRLTKLAGYGILLLSLFFMLIPEQLILFALTFLPTSSPIAAKMFFYLSTEQYKPQLAIGIGTIFDILLIAILVYSNSLLSKFNSSIGDDFIKNKAITIFGVLLYISFAIVIGKVMPVMTRFGWYFFPYIIILIYVNIGRSFVFLDRRGQCSNLNLVQVCIFVFMIMQVVRPFMYDISRYNLQNQKTIFEKIDDLTDAKLRIEAIKKCDVLYKLNAGFLCSL